MLLTAKNNSPPSDTTFDWATSPNFTGDTIPATGTKSVNSSDQSIYFLKKKKKFLICKYYINRNIKKNYLHKATTHSFFYNAELEGPDESRERK
jgi:hypothetical protein